MSEKDWDRVIYKVAMEMSMDENIKKRVFDPSKPVKDFDDVLELGMYGSLCQNNSEDFKFLEGLQHVEMKLPENPEFKKLSSQMAMMRKQVADSPVMKQMKSFAKVNKALADDPTWKSLVDGQNEIRKQALKLALPSINIPDAFKRVHDITRSHQQYHNDEQERMQLEVEKSEMEMYANQLELKTLSVKSKDAVWVSDYYKQHVKNIQPHIKRNETRKPTGEREESAKMKRHMYQLFVKYRSMKIGKLFPDEDDARKHKYTRQECYNLISAKHYDNKSPATIEKYIKQFIKKNR